MTFYLRHLRGRQQQVGIAWFYQWVASLLALTFRTGKRMTTRFFNQNTNIETCKAISGVITLLITVYCRGPPCMLEPYFWLVYWTLHFHTHFFKAPTLSCGSRGDSQQNPLKVIWPFSLAGCRTTVNIVYKSYRKMASGQVFWLKKSQFPSESLSTIGVWAFRLGEVLNYMQKFQVKGDKDALWWSSLSAPKMESGHVSTPII